ncbi:FKBP-type peptidyl-prolyl cis-trans isomerase [Pontibacter arcticus]|uniref:Peptidyl-prolyl cis-trans isomerase n=1 Tax=Pontibacter arcticus TaxID=2080288 RepID=A0A364RI52_9BACT|nr:FKBP-type peptidyl-prolyl cis-trans isomerase [Pontibacter arcticus]RAU83955.1 hypothetical protein DP923_02510 [Pontibacter arcticus]
MLSKSKFLLPVLAGALLLQGCKGNKDEFHTTDGLTYKIYSQNDKGVYENKGEVNLADSTGAKIGQVVTLQMSYKNAEDSLLFNSRENRTPIMLPVMKSPFKGSLEQALMSMQAGDSGVFKINADSLFAKSFGGQPLPPFIKKGSDLTFFIKVDKIQSEQDAMASQQKMMEEQMKGAAERAEKQTVVDDAKIQEYIKANNLQNVQKTESGVYYVITQPGKGPKAAAGNLVSVHYKGMFLDGKEFDSSYNNPMSGGKPFEFPLGQGQVIPGWDDGIKMLNKGSKAILLIPSPLAYGEQERGPDMPANSILRFDVELVDVKN